MEPLLKALQACLPSSVRVGDALRVPEVNGSVRVIVPRSPHDPQVDHGLVLGFAPALEDGLTLDACHLRARCRRSPEAIEAAQAYGRGEELEMHATRLAVEAVRQLSEVWQPFLKPEAWVGPAVEDLLRTSANAGPQDAEPLLAAIRAAALNELGKREDARGWMETAQKAVDPRIRSAVARVRTRLADA
jgi:hypothetical protein